MSVCKARSTNSGTKRKHQYPVGTNKCTFCGHVTTHGANYKRTRK